MGIKLVSVMFVLDYDLRVRAFERVPLRCYWCQDYGQVAAVCRKGVPRKNARWLFVFTKWERRSVKGERGESEVEKTRAQGK